jgi:hypothetical protein
MALAVELCSAALDEQGFKSDHFGNRCTAAQSMPDLKPPIALWPNS